MSPHEKIAAIAVIIVLVIIEIRWRPAQRLWNRRFWRRSTWNVVNPYAHEEHYPQPVSVAHSWLKDETPAGTIPGLLPSAADLTQAYERLAEPCGNTRCKWFGEDHLGECEKAPEPELAPPLAELPAFVPGRQPWEDEDQTWDEAPVGRYVAAQFSHNGEDVVQPIQPDGGLQFAGGTWLPYPPLQQEPAPYTLGNGLVIEDDDGEGPMTQRIRESFQVIEDTYERQLEAEILRRQAASMVELDEVFAINRIREHAAAR